MSIIGYTDTHYARTLTNEQDYPALDGDYEVDVCVVGGGLAGLNTALGLVERGLSVIVLESNRIGWAASGRNGGFVDKGYAAGEVELVGKLGLAKAQGLVTLTKRARALIKKRIETYSIDCGPVIDGVLNISVRDNPEKIRAHVEEANADFDLGYEYWPRDKVRDLCKTDGYYDAYFSPHDFQFSPLSYVQGLARAIASKGGKIFENSAALKITRDKDGDWTAHTATGNVRARDIVVCCSTDVRKLDHRLDNAVFPVETYVMATEPIDPQLLAETVNTRYAVYELRFACNYYRRIEGNRLLWGGRVALGSKPHDIAADMLHDMFKVYPKLKGHVKPETAWSGLLCYAPHKMPQIGYFEDGYWFNTAFGGHGLCGTTVGGEVVAAAIADGDRTFQQFAPFRPFYAGGRPGRYVAEAAYLWWRARDFLGI